MTWLTSYWLLILLVVCCVGMMFFMRGGHDKPDRENDQHKH